MDDAPPLEELAANVTAAIAMVECSPPKAKPARLCCCGRYYYYYVRPGACSSNNNEKKEKKSCL